MGERRRGQTDRALASYQPTRVGLLDDEAARHALTLLRRGSSVRAVAEQFGTSIWCMYDPRGGRTHKHLDRG
jgi:hypothetical protein